MVAPYKPRKQILILKWLLPLSAVALILIAASLYSGFLDADKEVPTLSPERQEKLQRELNELEHAEQYVLRAVPDNWYPCYHIGLIAFDKDRKIALDVLPALEEELNRRIDLLSLDTPLRSMSITISLTGDLKALISRIEGQSLWVELPFDAEGLDSAGFEQGLRNRLSEVLRQASGPVEVWRALTKR